MKLAEYCKIELSVIQRTFFDNVNSFHLEGRYPEYKKEFNKIANFEFTELHFTKIKETYLWLKSLMK